VDVQRDTRWEDNIKIDLQGIELCPWTGLI